MRIETKEKIYDEKHWHLLKILRTEATKIMEALEKQHISSVVHGSIARGDVNQKSDIDVFIPQIVSSFTIETALENSGFPILDRFIVQATPSYAIKGYIEIGEKRTVSFPLTKMRKKEREFYIFSGEATLDTIKNNLRVPGVDKRLMLIEPTHFGHTESSIIGREEHVASLLKISVETVIDRCRALTRRDKVGRTGLFIERSLMQNETFESTLKKLADEKPEVRRRLRII
ncbi:MAG: nucleotidyltransferase domain-containing protein [Candidatus Bathyarchaeia archaeon]